MSRLSAEQLHQWAAGVASWFRSSEEDHPELTDDRDAYLVEFAVRALKVSTDATAVEIRDVLHNFNRGEEP